MRQKSCAESMAGSPTYLLLCLRLSPPRKCTASYDDDDDDDDTTPLLLLLFVATNE